MRRLYSISFLILLMVAVAAPVSAQVVVPAGSIKPEGGGDAGGGEAPRKVRRRAPAATVVKSGESFMIQMATVLSSGITKAGETVYFTAAEDVGKGNRSVITHGAVGKGTVKEVKSNSKAGQLVVSLDSIEAVNGESVSLGGDVSIQGEGSQASAAVGERFTATLDEQVVVRGRPRKPDVVEIGKKGNAEILGKGVKADIKKGSVKGKVEVLLEAPRGLTVEDIDPTTIALYKVNNFSIPNPVPLSGNKAKTKDRNKNGVPDISVEIGAWDFIKYQPRGNNIVTFRGRLNNGEVFEATSGVTIDY